MANTSITIPGLTAGNTYRFQVTAYTNDGFFTSQPSLTSDPYKVKYIPSAPTGAYVASQTTPGVLSIYFNPSSDFGAASSIAYYTITPYLSGTPDIIDNQHQATGPAGPILVSGLSVGSTYKFTVKANNTAFNSDESDKTDSIILLDNPSAPPNFTSNQTTDGVITFSYGIPRDKGGSEISYYTITPVGQPGVTGTSSSLSINGLTVGTSYTFNLTATNTLFTSLPSTLTSTIYATPGPPTNISALSQTVIGQIAVGFTGPANVGGGISYYTVTPYLGATGLSGVTGTTSPIVVPGLTNGSTYTFDVKSSNPYYTSSPSSTVSSTLMTLPDAPPTVSINTQTTIGQLSIAFGEPIFKGNSTITKYTVTPYLNGSAAQPLLAATGTTSPITVTGLTNGSPYSFKVSASNLLFTGPDTSTMVTSVMTTPDAPTGVSVNTQTQPNQITVGFTGPAFTGNSAITMYTVIPYIGGASQNAVTGTVAPIIVTGLTAGTDYKFRVKASNLLFPSAESTETSPITVYGTPGVPTAPYVISQTVVNQMSVGFTPTSVTGGPVGTVLTYTVTSYVGGAAQTTATGTASPIILSGLTAGTSYTFRVKASNTKFTSVETVDTSPAVTVLSTPGVPSSTPTVAAQTVANQLTVSFGSSSSGGGTVTYTVTSTPDGKTATGASSPITVTGLTAGTSYTFKVKASNSLFTSGETLASSATTVLTNPGAPTIGTVSVTNKTTASVPFTTTTNYGGAASVNYRATSNPGSITATNSTTPISVTGLTPGLTYNFTVVSYNILFTSASSGISTPSTLLAVVPTAPTIGTATTASSTSATVGYTANDNGGSTVTSYTATSNPDGKTASGTSNPLTVTGLRSGISYTFTVTATNAVGTSAASSPASNSITTYSAPVAPTIGTATATGQTTATVTFTANGNGGSAITGFTVTSSGGQTATGTSSPITFSNLVAGTNYTFTVTATNAIGTSTSSAASNQITTASAATVPDPPANNTITAVYSPYNPNSAATQATFPGTKATIYFSQPTNTGGVPIQNYTVTAKPINNTTGLPDAAIGPNVTATGNSSPIAVTGLSGGGAIRYVFTVKSYNGYYTSAESGYTPLASTFFWRVSTTSFYNTIGIWSMGTCSQSANPGSQVNFKLYGNTPNGASDALKNGEGTLLYSSTATKYAVVNNSFAITAYVPVDQTGYGYYTKLTNDQGLTHQSVVNYNA